MSTSKLIELNIEILRQSHITEQKRLEKLKKDSKKKSKDEDSDRISRAHIQPNLDLEQGKNLPEYLQGDVEDHYKCKPLVDIDPYYEDKQTYVILDENFSIYRFSTTDALFCLGPLNCLRRIANKIFVHSFFNSVIMFTILVNCGVMTMNTDGEDTKWIEKYVENVFLGIYSFEMIVKVLSRGFVWPHFTYLRDPWNILDISVIATAYLDIAMQQAGGGEGGTIPGMAALRAFRVLRALKAISAIPGLKAIVSALIESVKALKDVMILTLFCLSVFALIGLQLFMGSLRNKCVLNWPPSIDGHPAQDAWNSKTFTQSFLIQPAVDPELRRSQFAFQSSNKNKSKIPYTVYIGNNMTEQGSLISLPMFCDRNPAEKCANGSFYFNQTEEEWLNDECNYCYVGGAAWLCGNGSGAGGCQDNYTCLQAGENPNFGYTSFDTFPAALLSLFRLLAQDYWENLYMLTLRANGQVYLIFFMLVIFLGSFYLINLILAVVAMAYDEQHQIVAAEEERKRRLMQEKKQQLEAMIQDITMREDQLQSGKISQMDGGIGSGRSSPRESSIDSSKRFLDQRRNTLVLSHDKAKQPTIEYALNDNFRSSLASDTIDVEGGMLALIKPSGILRNSPGGSIRGSTRNLGLEAITDRRKIRHYTEGSENEGKGSLSSLLGGKNNDIEGLEFNGICDLNPPHSTDLKISNREDHIHHSNKTMIVDQNGIISMVPAADSLVRQRGSSPIDVPPPRSRISAADSDCRPQIDYLRPNPPMQHSRLSLTIENMTEPQQLAKLKQRAMSQATVMSEGIEPDPTQTRWYQFLHKYCIWDCCPQWLYLQKMMKVICNDCFFDLFITLCIVANTVFLGLEHYPMDTPFENMLKHSNTVFSLIFLGELVIKMIGMHPFYYFQEAWNIFDFVIVTVSMLEMGLDGVEGLSVLRSFRLMRVFKLAKSWPTLNMLIQIIVKSMGSLGNLTLILLILLFIFAVVGKQLFRNDYNAFMKKNEGLRWHMDDFFHSFLIVFRILCGEWIETMWDCMRIVQENSGPNLKAVCIPVFLLVQIVGNLVVLNLFLALLLSSFTGNLEPDPDGEENSIQKSMRRVRRFRTMIVDYIWDKRTALMKCWGRQLAHNGSSKGDRSDINSSSSSPISAPGCHDNNEIKSPNHIPLRDNSNSDHIIPHPKNLASYDGKGIELVGTLPNCVVDFIQVPKATAESDFGKDDSDVESGHSHGMESSMSGSESSLSSSSSMSNSEYERQQAIDLQLQKTQAEKENLNEPAACCPVGCIKKFPFLDPPTETYFMNMWWNARKISYRIVEHPWFEMFIILMILLSSAALAFEDVYYPHKPTLKKVLKYADRIFTYIFILEMFLKWLGYGLKKYFTNAWCGLDFMIVAVSIVGLVTDALGLDNIPGIRSLRTLRAMRPLRALSRFQGMKVVVNALIGAIPSIFNVLMVCLIFWLIFSIMGVNLFAGKFYKCMNVTSGDRLYHMNVTFDYTHRNNGSLIKRFYEPVINQTVCKRLELETNNEIMWVNSKITFDNAFSGYLALLQVATFKGWMPIMYDAVDMTDVGLQPIYENSVGYYVYFIAFIVFGSFCTLNLFIGVIIDNFNQQKKKLGGQDIFMTEEQRKYYNAMKKLGSKKPQKPVPRPRNKFQGWVFDIVTHQIFEITIMLLIIANMVTMMIEHHNMSKDLDGVLVYINYVFVAIFSGEALIKLFALRHHYFTNPWNVFDFIVVIFSIVGSALNDLINKYLVQPTLFRIIRLARIGRILRLIKGAKGIRTLLFALMMSLPALVNIGLLLILVMFIYSIFGMSQFSYVKRMSGVDDLYNFETFTNSFICLFMITTSAGWDGLLQPLLNSKFPDCDSSLENGNPSGNGDCGSPAMGIAFFVTYLIFTFLIVVNMYIAIILENFGVATEESTDPLGEEDFEMFYEVWERFDPKATQFIAYGQLSDMVDSLHPPLRVPKPNQRALVAMDLPMVIGDRLHCLDILFALTKRVLGESDELEGLRSQMEEKFMASNPSKVSYEPITTTLWRKQEELSAVRIQRWWRSFKFRRTIYAASNMALKQAQASPLTDEDQGGNFQQANGLPMNGHDGPPMPGTDEDPLSYTFHPDSVDFHVDLNGVLAEEQKEMHNKDEQGDTAQRPHSNGSTTTTTNNTTYNPTARSPGDKTTL